VRWSYDWDRGASGSDYWAMVLDWLQGQGIEPEDIPWGEEMSVVETPQGLLLRYARRLMDDDGAFILCSHGSASELDAHPAVVRTAQIVSSYPVGWEVPA